MSAADEGGQLDDCRQVLADCVLADLPVEAQWFLVAVLCWEAVANVLRLAWMRARPNDPFPLDWWENFLTSVVIKCRLCYLITVCCYLKSLIVIWDLYKRGYFITDLSYCDDIIVKQKLNVNNILCLKVIKITVITALPVLFKSCKDSFNTENSTQPFEFLTELVLFYQHNG